MSIHTTYAAYRTAGMTHEGALGMLGNGDCESNNISCRVQGDFTAGFQKSREYTRHVDAGQITEAGFCNGLTGYGLYQWTAADRQRKLYKWMKSRGTSIGNEVQQVQFSIYELKNDFPSVWTVLTSSHDLYTCSDIVCKVYENPKVKNYAERRAAAERIEAELAGDSDPSPEPDHPDPTPISEYWPPRMVDKSMSGPDVEVAQAILKARGYAINYIGGKFDDLLDAEVKKFQGAAGLTKDGVIGPLTWAALLTF